MNDIVQITAFTLLDQEFIAQPEISRCKGCAFITSAILCSTTPTCTSNGIIWVRKGNIPVPEAEFIPELFPNENN